MDTSNPLVILTASRSEYGDEINAVRSQMLQQQLDARNISYQFVDGHFDGVRERAFLVFTLEDSNEFHLLISLARRYGQTCVLVVDAHGLGYLRFLDGRPDEEVGRFREITAYEASRHPRYSEIDGRYFAVNSSPACQDVSDPGEAV